MKMTLTRRDFLEGAAMLTAVSAAGSSSLASGQQVYDPGPAQPLTEFGYDQVQISGRQQVLQRTNVTSILMGLDENSLLKPFREMTGQPSPGVSLGGWYEWNPAYNYHHSANGLAPGSTFGQWTSAMARLHAGSCFGGAAGSPSLRLGPYALTLRSRHF